MNPPFSYLSYYALIKADLSVLIHMGSTKAALRRSASWFYHADRKHRVYTCYTDLSTKPICELAG